MRCASWRSSGWSSSARSSGWPIRMICSSLVVAVSRLVSSRTCSSVSRAEVLRLVDDQHHAAAAGVRVEQLPPDQVHQRLGAVAPGLRHVDVQLLADGEQELGGRDARVEDQRDVGVARQLLEQAADDRGLAGAHLAGQLDEAARLVDAVQQVRERLRMPLAEVQVAGVGGDRERLFLESEKARVHAGLGEFQAARGPSMMPARAGMARVRALHLSRLRERSPAGG